MDPELDNMFISSKYETPAPDADADSDAPPAVPDAGAPADTEAGRIIASLERIERANEALLGRLERMERENEALIDLIDRVAADCRKMSSHVGFVEGVYGAARRPLNYILGKVNAIAGTGEGDASGSALPAIEYAPAEPVMPPPGPAPAAAVRSRGSRKTE
jgi:hypothetical protein